jgi:hypothetical protein
MTSEKKMVESLANLRSKASALFIAALFLFGLYVPSSIAGDYSIPLWLGVLGFLGLTAAIVSLRPNGIGGQYCVINSLLLVAAIIAGSILSPFPDYRWGGLLPYLVVALVYTLRISDLSGGRTLRVALTVANIVNLVAGAAVVFHNAFIDNFLVTHYTTFYPELVSAMTERGKPVLTFGSHSTAAFFFYLLFLLNLETFAVLKGRSYFCFALCYLVLGFALFSVTGVVLMSVGAIQLVIFVALRNWRRFAVVATIAVAAIVFLVKHYATYLQDTSEAIFLAEQAATTSDINGFSGRFSELGTMYTTVRYIKDRPFSPVGVGYRGDLFFGDCGPVEYYLRGSLVLVCCMYGGLFLFLKRNLVSKKHLFAVFAVILAFEVGFSSLTYVRLLCLMPVLVIYLNDLARKALPNSSRDLIYT